MYAVFYFTWTDSRNQSYGVCETGRTAMGKLRFYETPLRPSDCVMLIPNT